MSKMACWRGEASAARFGLKHWFHSRSGHCNPARKRDLESMGGLLGIRDWFDSGGWFPPSGGFDSRLPPLARPPLFWGLRPLHMSPGKIHRFLDSQPLFLSPGSEGLVEPGQAASRGVGAYKPEVLGKKGSKDNAGEAWKGRPGQKPCFSLERVEEKRSMRKPTLFS